MFKLVIKRVALGVLTLVGVSLLIFAGTEILPGDVAEAILGQSATPEAIANIRRDLGLDQPAWVRYLSWLGGLLHGDLGVSLSNRQDIAMLIGERLGNTVFLASTAAVISVPLAVTLGMVSVRYQNTWLDRLLSVTTLGAISLPEFFIGYLLVTVFAVNLGWFGALSTVYEGMGFIDRFKAIVLPTLTLTLVVLAHMLRMTRAAILNVMTSSYIETAELKGLRRSEIIFRHALPNALSPILNVVVINLAYLVVGVVVVEVIFVYPGMGQLMVDHVAKRDVPVIQACGMIFATTYVGLNLLADILAIASNPRLRHAR